MVQNFPYTNPIALLHDIVEIKFKLTRKTDKKWKESLKNHQFAYIFHDFFTRNIPISKVENIETPGVQILPGIR